MPILSINEPIGAWRGPKADDVILDGLTYERVMRGIERGYRLRQIGRHTVLEAPVLRSGMLRAYLTIEEVEAL